METREQNRRPIEKRVLQTPKNGGSVWPNECCPAFAARRSGLCCGPECWFCRYANFHLRAQTALEVGVCCWPKTQID